MLGIVWLRASGIEGSGVEGLCSKRLGFWGGVKSANPGSFKPQSLKFEGLGFEVGGYPLQ